MQILLKIDFHFTNFHSFYRHVCLQNLEIPDWKQFDNQADCSNVDKNFDRDNYQVLYDMIMKYGNNH